MPHASRRCAPLVAALSLAAAGAVHAAAPEVLKVEPPGWWVGHSLNPVRLLIRGRNLAGARIEARGAGLAASGARVNAAGTYLFVDVAIDPHATPGVRRLEISTAGGAAEAPFEVAAPLQPEGRFEGFSQDDVIYMVLPDRFANGDPANDDPPASRGLTDRRQRRYYHGGDLQGILDHLPYLKDLGVTTLWLGPVYDNVDRPNERERHDESPVTDYHGYGAVDFYGVEEHFGDLAKLRQLVDAAHRMGLKVIQDQVANHTGPYHPWAADPPTPTWFNGTAAKHLANSWQIWTLVDPHASPDARKATLDGWFIDLLPDLNQDDPEVARYLIQNSLWWVGAAGFDGIREDTLPYVPRRFWHDWTAALKREHPRLRVVGEMWDGDPGLVSFFQGGAVREGVDSGVDSLFDFPLVYPLRRAFAEGQPLRQVAQMLARDGLYPDASALVTFLGNHDMPRFMSEPGATAAGLRLALSFLLTTRGIPALYYGDEIGLPGANDPDNRRDFPGGWREDPRSAFEVKGRDLVEQSVFDHVRRLTRLRSELEPLRRGSLVELAVEDQTWAYARITPRASVLVVLNNASSPSTVECGVGPAGIADGALLEDRLGEGGAARVEGGRLRVTLPARSAAIYVPR